MASGWPGRTFRSGSGRVLGWSRSGPWFGSSVASIGNTPRCIINILYVYIYAIRHLGYEPMYVYRHYTSPRVMDPLVHTRTSHSITNRARGHGRPIPAPARSCPTFILHVDHCLTLRPTHCRQATQSFYVMSNPFSI
jgi:hypothetical protein